MTTEQAPEVFERVIKIFQKHEQVTKENSRRESAEALKEFKHFRALSRQENCMDYLYSAIPVLKYQRVKKKDFVFHHSDKGGVFYFILKGRAAVFIPKSDEQLAKEIQLHQQIEKWNQALSESVIPEEIAMLLADLASAKKQLESMQQPASEDLLSKQRMRYFKEEGKVCLFKQVNVLHSTDSFGEVSIISQKKLRTASIVAQDEELHLLSISGENYISIFDQELSRLNFTLKVLEEAFPTASRDSIVRLAYEFKEVVMEKKQIIFKEGSPAKQVYLVKSGEVEIFKELKKQQISTFYNTKGNTRTRVKNTPSNFINKCEYKEIVIAILGVQTFFGMEGDKQYSFSARSGSSSAIVFSIDKSLLEEYGVMKLLQRHTQEKTSFYSERLNSLLSFEEKQDLQRQQLKQPDLQSLLNQSKPKKIQAIEERQEYDSSPQSLMQIIPSDINETGKRDSGIGILIQSTGKRDSGIGIQNQSVNQSQDMMAQNTDQSVILDILNKNQRTMHNSYAAPSLHFYQQDTSRKMIELLETKKAYSQSQPNIQMKDDLKVRQDERSEVTQQSNNTEQNIQITNHLQIEKESNKGQNAKMRIRSLTQKSKNEIQISQQQQQDSQQTYEINKILSEESKDNILLGDFLQTRSQQTPTQEMKRNSQIKETGNKVEDHPKLHLQLVNKTTQNVSSLHSIQNNNTSVGQQQSEQNNNNNSLTSQSILYFGEEKKNEKAKPKLQFKVVIQDFITSQEQAQTVKYFKKGIDSEIGPNWVTPSQNVQIRTPRLSKYIEEKREKTRSNSRKLEAEDSELFILNQESSKDIFEKDINNNNNSSTISKKKTNKIAKKWDGLENQIETMTVKDKINLTLEYNQVVLDQKKQEQVSRLKYQIEQEKMEKIKSMKKARLLQKGKRDHDDYLCGLSEEDYYKLFQKKLQLSKDIHIRSDSSSLFSLTSQKLLSTHYQSPKDKQFQSYNNSNKFKVSIIQETNENEMLDPIGESHLLTSLPILAQTNKALATPKLFTSQRDSLLGDQSASSTQFGEARRVSSILYSNPYGFENAGMKSQISSKIRYSSQIQSYSTLPVYGIISRPNQSVSPSKAVVTQYQTQREDHSTQSENHRQSQQSYNKSNFILSNQTLNQSKERALNDQAISSYDAEFLSSDELHQLHQFASMHLNKSGRAQLYKKKPNFHQLDKKKIKVDAQLEPLFQASSKIQNRQQLQFPVIHSINQSKE